VNGATAVNFKGFHIYGREKMNIVPIVAIIAGILSSLAKFMNR
jgi:hypothetical protein